MGASSSVAQEREGFRKRQAKSAALANAVSALGEFLSLRDRRSIVRALIEIGGLSVGVRHLRPIIHNHLHKLI
jgi:hypothetical protein